MMKTQNLIIEDFPIDFLDRFSNRVRIAVSTLSEPQARNVWENLRQEIQIKYGDIPPLMRLLDCREGNYDFKTSLIDSKEFCARAGIANSGATDYWDYIRAGAAEACLEELKRFQ